MEILGAYWDSDRGALLLISGVVALSSITTVAAPYVFSRLLDWLPREGAGAMLTLGFVLYAVLLGVAAVLQQVVQYLSFMSAENLGFIAGTRSFERVLNKTSAFFLEYNPVEIQNATARGRGALTTLVQLALIVFIPGAIQISLTLITLGAMIDLQVVAIVAVYGASAVTLTLVAARRTRGFLDAAVAAGQENARFVGNAMNAMETLRHFNSQGWMNSSFATKAAEVRDSWRCYVMRRLAYIAVLGLGLSIQFGVTCLLLLPRYERGALTVGDIVLFNTLLLQLNLPFQMIAHAIDDVARAWAALVPLATMWAAPDERQVANRTAFALRDGRIVFEDVGYAYDNGRGVTGITFTAERGAITFLVGETGSGKSTMFKLALKSIDPDRGNILIDGVALSCIDRGDWYNAVAVVPQDVVLLNESLCDNIILGRPLDMARLRRVAEKAAILSFIDSLPGGFDAKVGERGLKLSGGERQRVAIARALYGEPGILFLDEASSALDEATERDIIDHVRSLSREVTVIAITHRRTVIAPGDRVVELSVS